MNVHIRYALGHSGNGDFLAAMADQELVAFEFPVHAGNAVGRLMERFPGAVLEQDESGLATTVATLARVVESPAVRDVRDRSSTSVAPTLGIIAHSNRLVRSNGSVAGGRACAVSVRAAARRVLPGIPRAV